MAGAFTAQADDPSMLFYNAGGLAFVEKTGVSVGATWIRSTKADFQRRNPFPGPGYSAEQKTLSEFPPHAYCVQPLTSTWKFGLGIETPFGLTTEWKNPDQFAGRFLSTKASLQAFDINPTLGWQVTPTFGIGVGGIVRVSKVELNRHIAAINPFTLMAADVGRLKLTSDYTKNSYGFNIGILHRWNESFSWGLSYRSKISVDYDGSARLTQISTGNPQFDAIVGAQIPFNTKLPVKTAIDYPDQASLGLAFALTRDLLLETDFNYTGWSSFKSVPINFTGGAGNSLPDTTPAAGLEERLQLPRRPALDDEPVLAVALRTGLRPDPAARGGGLAAPPRRRPHRLLHRLRPHHRLQVRHRPHVPRLQEAHREQVPRQ